jgi:alpha-galactosidase
MNRVVDLAFKLTQCCALMFLVLCEGFATEEASITVRETPQGREIRYVSGKAVYVEAFSAGRLVSRYWDDQSREQAANRRGEMDAFEIEIKDMLDAKTPTPWWMAGKFLSTGWQWESAGELPKTDRGARHFVVELSNSILPFKIKVHTLLDGTPVLRRWLEITNTSNKSLALSALSPWAGPLWAEDAPIVLGHSIKWETLWEGWFGWTPLHAGTNLIEETRGVAYDDPYFVLHNESRGDYFFGELAWPANYRMEFQKVGGLTFKIGPAAIDSLRVIAAGETITTPAVSLGYIKGDFDDAVQAMHDHFRRAVLPTHNLERAYRVQYSLPEDQPETVYRGSDYNESNIKKCMDAAAAAGMEVVTLDGPMWCSAYGNWLVPDPKRFPHGLAPLVEYAHEKGLLFGLYAEPEGGREGFCSEGHGACIGYWSESAVFQEHSDWFDQPLSVLKLSKPEAAAYLDSEMNQIIDFYKPDLYRHDFNAPLRHEGSETVRDGFLESDYWRHYDAFYNIYRGIHEKYPNLILQQAAAGGTRLDPATVGVFQEHTMSDRLRTPYVYQMISGLSVFLPPEILVAPHGMAGRNQPDMETMLRGAFAVGNTPMIFHSMMPASLEEFTPELRAKWLHYANLYKNFIRPMLPTCRVYHHAPVSATGGVESGNWFAMEFTSQDKSKGWATIIRLAKGSATYHLNLKGLDGKRRYRVTFDNTGKTEEMDASTLAQKGLEIRTRADAASELMLFEAL